MDSYHEFLRSAIFSLSLLFSQLSIELSALLCQLLFSQMLRIEATAFCNFYSPQGCERPNKSD